MNIPNSIRTVLRIYPYLWPKDNKIRLRLCIGILLLIATVFFNVGIPIVLRKVIDLISYPETTFPFIITAFLIAYGVVWMCGILTDKLRWVAVYGVIERARRLMCLKVFDHLLSLSLNYHASRKTGHLVNTIERAQFSFWPFFGGLFFLIIPTLVEILFASAILTWLYGFAYGSILFFILSIFLIVSVYGSKLSVKTQENANVKTGEASSVIVDSLMNYETIRYFVAQNYEHKRCDNILLEREKTATRHYTIAEIVLIIQSLVMGAGLVILTWMSGQQVVSGILKVSDFVLINIYLLQFMTPLGYFGNILRDMNEGITNLSEVTAILDEKPEIQDKEQAKEICMQAGRVIFDQVSFAYDPRRPILQSISFEIPAGKTVAIVGTTGAGKSTIAKLLFRYYEVSAGSITIDGQDIRDVTQKSLQSKIGVVPQHTALFNDTLLYNIAYGNSDATQDDIRQAIKRAHLENFIASLPDGLDTKVGEHGLQLSGGERQRVAIARVLLKQPALFIFDEATSSLDTQTEHLIQNNIEEVSNNVSTLIIAHRLSTVIHADNIIVIEHGQIVEQGNHADLLAHASLYAQLWKKQTKGHSSQ